MGSETPLYVGKSDHNFACSRLALSQVKSGSGKSSFGWFPKKSLTIKEKKNEAISWIKAEAGRDLALSQNNLESEVSGRTREFQDQ